MIKVLAIGNSFSDDAMRYLHRIAKADGIQMKTVNLYIGGCPLYKHYINALEDKAQYSLQFNGDDTGFGVSIKQALINDEWDYVTLQQVSHCSPDYNTYQPYLDYMAEYVRKYAPKAKLLIHQTWAYEQDSDRLTKELGYEKYTDMLCDIKKAYDKAAKAVDAVGIIPSGETMHQLLENGIKKVHRDGFHASLGLGRYALGLTWYHAITGNDIDKNKFCDFDEPVSTEEITIAKKSAKTAVSKYKF